jgi:4-diphosphocytidyl-2-C-methyl-D-erythritol kinase
MIAFPPAKINLGLHILNKREDGYHAIESLFYPIPFCDILEVVEDKNSNTYSFTASGLEISGDIQDNLCVKAYTLLKRDFNIGGVKIHLHKIIPMGAGLGGGSADASYTLLSLNEIFKLNLSVENLKMYAAHIGSDCAFFIENKAQYAKGRGEMLENAAINLDGFYLKLVFPGIHISTKEAYASVVPEANRKSIQVIVNNPIHQWPEILHNDFEKSIFPKHPILSKIKSDLYKEGALYAAMSGSGSTLFGIYNFEPSKKMYSKEQIIALKSTQY